MLWSSILFLEILLEEVIQKVEIKAFMHKDVHVYFQL